VVGGGPDRGLVVGFGVVAAAGDVALAAAAVLAAGGVLAALAAPAVLALAVPLAAAGDVTGVVRARVTFGFGLAVGSGGGVWSAMCLA
jgi:hypothetical protein